MFPVTLTLHYNLLDRKKTCMLKQEMAEHQLREAEARKPKPTALIKNLIIRANNA